MGADSILRIVAWGIAFFGLVLVVSAFVTRLLVRRAEVAYPPADRSVVVDGVRLRYFEKGSGRPVILIHGLRGSSYDFAVSIIGRLARHCRVIAFDRPGHGYSDAPVNEVHTLASEAQLLHAAADLLSLKRPLVVGYSLGAAVAMAYGDAYPEDVAGVVTISGHVLPFRVPVGLLARLAKRPWIGGVSSNTLVIPIGHLVGRSLLRRACSPRPVPPWYSRLALAMALRPRTFRYAPAELGQSGDDLRELAARYGSLPVPVTVVGGCHDAIVSFSQAERFHRRLATSTLVAVPDGGHALHVTHPDEVVAAVVTALGSTDGRRAEAREAEMRAGAPVDRERQAVCS